jgi:hypothetical protein
VLGALAMVGCQLDGPGVTPSARNAGFKDNYTVARTALEKGQFAKAQRSYKDLLLQAGPLEPRIRLEYAHVLLRAGKFAEASGEARVAASMLDGAGRAAAIAVQATADQELVRKALNAGTADAASLQRLVAARDGFDEVLKTHPELDPLGGLALRRKTIEVELAQLNG